MPGKYFSQSEHAPRDAGVVEQVAEENEERDRQQRHVLCSADDALGRNDRGGIAGDEEIRQYRSDDGNEHRQVNGEPGQQNKACNTHGHFSALPWLIS